MRRNGGPYALSRRGRGSAKMHETCPPRNGDIGKAIPADIRSAEKNTSSHLHNPFGLGGAVRQGDAQQIDARHEARQIDVGRGTVGGGEQPFNQFL